MSGIPNPYSFEKLRVRYRLRADLVARTGLRVGAGKSFDAAATDQPVIRDALGYPYIPGSSLKGALRSGLESILRGLDLDEAGVWACNLFEDGPRCIGDAKKDEERQKRNQPIPLEEVLERTCTACSLFGSSFLAGRIFISDLFRASGAPTELRDGVGLDRDLGTASPGIKYDVEVVPAGTCFKLEVLIENVDQVRLALALQALELLDEGEILLGGMSSRGLGRVKLENCSLERTDPTRLLNLEGNRYEALDYGATLKESRAELLLHIVGEKEDEAHA